MRMAAATISCIGSSWMISASSDLSLVSMLANSSSKPSHPPIVLEQFPSKRPPTQRSLIRPARCGRHPTPQLIIKY